MPAAAQNWRVETLADGLRHPWGLSFLPDGSMLVTERPGRLRRIDAGGTLSEPIDGVPEVFTSRQGGLFEAVPHPDFAANRLVYLVYSEGSRSANTTRLARARLSQGGDALTDLEVLFDAMPRRRGGFHYGGRLVFLPDGTLLLTLGDAYRLMDEAQTLDDHQGKIVRLNDDGSVPADNPFVGQNGALPEIYSFGHRNPQGLVHDAAGGRIYAHEHGPRGGDEINIIEPGVNYGWPRASYGIDYSGEIITPYQEYEGTRQPMLHWTPSIAPSGMTLYDGALFPQWRGDLLVGALVGRHVRRVDLDENGAEIGQEELFGALNRRIRDVRTGPGGALYLLTDHENGAVLRVTPAE